MTVPVSERPAVVVGRYPLSRLLVILALVFAILAALNLGGIWPTGALAWLTPAALASYFLSLLVP